MHIALFGGSFDPPHFGHLLVADTLISQKYVDALWFVPCADHPFQKILSESNHRIAMLKQLSNHSICTYEVFKTGVSYSIETLEYFQRLFPVDTFSWVMGSDQLASFQKWHRYEDILKKFQVFMYPRKNFPAEPMLKGMTLIQGVEVVDISSTAIRGLVKEDSPLSSFTNKEIASYIADNRLYQS